MSELFEIKTGLKQRGVLFFNLILQKVGDLNVGSIIYKFTQIYVCM